MMTQEVERSNQKAIVMRKIRASSSESYEKSSNLRLRNAPFNVRLPLYLPVAHRLILAKTSTATTNLADLSFSSAVRNYCATITNSPSHR